LEQPNTLKFNLYEAGSIGAVFSPGKDLDFALGVLRNNDTATPQTSTTTATMGLTWRFR
jgi:hypothetical protein